LSGETYKVSKGDIFVILPGQVTTYRASEDNPWQYAWLCFCAPEIPKCLHSPVLRQPPVRHIFTYIRDHCQDNNLTGKIFSLTHELLWILSKDHEQPREKTSQYAVYAKTYLENSYMRQVSIQEIANTLHIDRRYLTTLFRKTYGIPPQTFLMDLRMDKAREFLEAGHRVTEAATMAGFSDLANFSKQFKARFGVNPSDTSKG